MRASPLLAILLVAACGGVTTSTSSNPPTSRATVTSSSTTTTTPAIGCPQDAEFIGSGRIGRITQPASDSKTLGLISRVVVDGCERFGFDFETAENAPATTPPSVEAEFLGGERIIRIRVDIDQTVITDQLVETDLVDRIFVVRDLDGSMFIDLHLRSPANARISVSNSPARLGLELNPRAGEIGPAAAFANDVVVITPQADLPVEGNFTVSGYARVFEANVLILVTRGDEVLARQSTTAADWSETWGEFSSDVTATSGGANLFVGQESPQDASLEGVTIRLTVR